MRYCSVENCTTNGSYVDMKIHTVSAEWKSLSCWKIQPSWSTWRCEAETGQRKDQKDRDLLTPNHVPGIIKDRKIPASNPQGSRHKSWTGNSGNNEKCILSKREIVSKVKTLQGKQELNKDRKWSSRIRDKSYWTLPYLVYLNSV